MLLGKCAVGLLVLSSCVVLTMLSGRYDIWEMAFLSTLSCMGVYSARDITWEGNLGKKCCLLDDVGPPITTYWSRCDCLHCDLPIEVWVLFSFCNDSSTFYMLKLSKVGVALCLSINVEFLWFEKLGRFENVWFISDSSILSTTTSKLAASYFLPFSCAF